MLLDIYGSPLTIGKDSACGANRSGTTLRNMGDIFSAPAAGAKNPQSPSWTRRRSVRRPRRSREDIDSMPSNFRS